MRQIANAAAARKSAAQGRKKKKTAKPGRKSSLPPFVKPQLATLTDDVPGGTDWIHESKFDGYRCLVAVGGGESRCYTRSGRDWTGKFNGLEGIVSKKAEAPYAGRRSRAWLKIKCTNRQEFVIGGYSRSDKRGRPFASLLIGAYEGDRLIYRGRVGTGFSEASMKEIADRLRKLRRQTFPFDQVPGAVSRDTCWVGPKLIAEVDFGELTDGGHVRHGAFRGLRQDKKPAEVIMEKTAGKAQASRGSNQEFHGIRLTHPDRVVFRDQGVSKADLAAYYEAVAHRMLPLMQNHPLSLVRCPKGADDNCFFQKHASDGFPDALKRVSIAESDGDTAEYLYVDDVAGLIAGVQMGTLEFHIWGSRIDRLEKPDRLVFDLDPDPQLDFEVVRVAATVVRDRLADVGLQSLALVTGGKGLHVVAPLRRTADWQTVKSFARAFAKSMAAAHPDAFTATLSKSRRHRKIFIDWLRNERGATAVAPYSSRAKQDAPVATPVSWKELGKVEAANTFSLHDVVQRMGRPDPWATYREISQSLTRKMLDSIS